MLAHNVFYKDNPSVTSSSVALKQPINSWIFSLGSFAVILAFNSWGFIFLSLNLFYVYFIAFLNFQSVSPSSWSVLINTHPSLSDVCNSKQSDGTL